MCRQLGHADGARAKSASTALRPRCLPTARAGATFQANIRAGKFQRQDSRDDPDGFPDDQPQVPRARSGLTEWNSLSAASAYQRKHLTGLPHVDRPRQSVIGFPRPARPRPQTPCASAFSSRRFARTVEQGGSFRSSGGLYATTCRASKARRAACDSARPHRSPSRHDRDLDQGPPRSPGLWRTAPGAPRQQKLPSTKAWVRCDGLCSAVWWTPPILPEARLCGHPPSDVGLLHPSRAFRFPAHPRCSISG